MAKKKQVYIIGPTGGPLKIGIAENSKNRRSILNVGNHRYLRVFHIHEAASEEEAFRLENELHFHFKESHIRGEWFNLTEADLPKVIQMFSSLLFFTSFAPDGWSLERKSCDEFTPEVCRIARRGLGLSTNELAQKTGLGQQTIGNFESGTAVSGIDTLEALKVAFEDLGVEFIKERTGGRLKVLI